MDGLWAVGRWSSSSISSGNFLPVWLILLIEKLSPFSQRLSLNVTKLAHFYDGLGIQFSVVMAVSRCEGPVCNSGLGDGRVGMLGSVSFGTIVK